LVNPEATARWLSADTVRQLDAGELGRGSRLLAESRGKAREFYVTYWEPGRALGLQYRGMYLRYSLRFDLEPEHAPVRIQVTAINQSSGLWRWPAAFIVWREQRRLISLILNTGNK
jgi:hypothetical protein